MNNIMKKILKYKQYDQNLIFDLTIFINKYKKVG